MTSIDARAEEFSAHRRYLFAVAYRMLGIAADAEDVLQDTWLRFSSVPAREVSDTRAYLVTIVTRLALDQLRSARRRREEYVGVWLPEPVRTEEVLPDELVERVESASFAFMLMLERLNELKRAPLVLHDVFDFSHEEIGRITGRTAAASRQTLARARRHLGGPRRHADDELPVALGQGTTDARGIPAAFLEATRSGDIERLLRLLAPDVVLLSDGGGAVRAANRPLAGSELVARFLLSMAATEEGTREGYTFAVHEVNGHPALLARLGGALTNVFLFDASPAGIAAIYVVRNPAKLERLQ